MICCVKDSVIQETFIEHLLNDMLFWTRVYSQEPDGHRPYLHGVDILMGLVGVVMAGAGGPAGGLWQ